MHENKYSFYAHYFKVRNEGRMNGYRYILAKQTEWARNQGKDLIGSKVYRGRPAYTIELDHNLFQPLLPEVQTSFASGDGSELGASGLPGKMQAIHSSLYESARHASAQAIVTRDAVGFKYAKIPVYSPEELIKMTQAIKTIEKNG
jgi:hypothetical protein